jgi:hypothetical protein
MENEKGRLSTLVKSVFKRNKRKGAKPQGRKERCIASSKHSRAETPAFSSHEPLVQQPAGLFLEKNNSVTRIKYAHLCDTHKPLGIAEYKLAQSLPDNLKGSLLTIEELEKELGELEEVSRDDE